ncbi:MAG: DNA-deoxyinosine glycosylase [Methanofollis sp.]|uniref:DNA-deoxyinosine glycosylase n=1 Tax=Methanofollis sp. TaxID=2052835 RepID=UPI00262AD579|nr:DNA-deoxyinosine glycosylase [Methanofollis sp.]MDD4255045.1 DNA-deoxyinosine glycosylase [Methanofollis sp.]
MTGLLPAAGRDPRVLILGSFPSVASLQAGEYYANPRNAFWQVMEGVFGVPADLPYEERLGLLAEKGVALWDVLAGCTREGSSDASIRDARANDIPGFLRDHPTVRTVALNGRAAEHWLRRVHPGVWEIPGVRVLPLPSTSPANARLSVEEKVALWRAAAGKP